MHYTSLDKYLADCPEADISQVFICDSKLSGAELNKITDKGFSPEQIIHYEDIFAQLENLFPTENKTISHIETEIIIEKIISKSSELKFLENQPSIISGFIQIINNTRLFPYYNQEIAQSIKEKSRLILELYKAECKKKNLTDTIDKLIDFSHRNIPKQKKIEKIVLLGDFFYLSQLHWQVLKNYCSKYQVTFVGVLAEYISEYFAESQSLDGPLFAMMAENSFVTFQNKFKQFFHSGEEGSLYHYLKNFKSEELDYSIYSDWEDEINHIAYQIRNDVSENKIDYSDIGIYLPAKLYKFKIDKIFADFEIPYYSTFTTSLAEIPLSKFISFYLEMDWTNLKDVFKLLNSPFVQINFSDFTLKEITEQIFLEKPLNEIELTLEKFDVKLFEEILNQSGIDNFYYQDVTNRKLKNYFEKEARFSLDGVDKVAKRYKTALIYLEYFQEKVKEFKAVLANTIYPPDFMNAFNQAIEYFNIKDNYIENGLPSIEFENFLNFWTDLANKLAQVNHKKHSLADYSKFYKKFCQNVFFNKNQEEKGVLISELPLVINSGLKRIYLVGMTSKLFPNQAENDLFSAQSQKINPIAPRDVQLFTFVELLKQYSDKVIELKLSYPKMIGKDDNEASELLVDIKIKEKFIKLVDNEKIFSHTDKCKSLAKLEIAEELNFQKLKELYQHRRVNNEWTKYEGHLQEIIDHQTFERQTSITQVEEFAACPMKFFFNRKLKIAAKKEKKNDLEANIKGDIVHKILESYYSKLIAEYDINLGFEAKLKLALEVSESVFKNFEEIYDNLYLDNLKYKMNTGLQSEIKKGIIFKVLEHDESRIKEGWLPSKFEHDFRFTIEDFKFTGSIDRIDINNDKFQIIDYKTGGFKTIDDVKDGLAFQLQVYGMAFSQETGFELDSAGYYALKDIDKIRTSLIIPEVKSAGKNKTILTDNQTIMNKTLEHLSNLKSFMKNSKYNYTIHDPEKVCSYCDYSTACHYDADKIYKQNQEKFLKEKLEYENNPDSEVADWLYSEPEKIKVLPGNIFSYGVGFFAANKGLTDEQKLALATDKNIIVTAGAGAGKTEVLTTRMLDLLDKTQGKIDKILVITFTKKATAEMQYRIYSSIVKKIVDGEDPHGYYLEAKLNFSKNWISTIDGFYMRILKENSLDMELEQEFKVAEPQELKQLIIETIEKKIDDLAQERNVHLEKLLHVWTRKQIIEHCETLLNKYWVYDFLKLESYDELFHAYQQIFKNDANEVIDAIDNLLKDNTYSEANGFPVDSINALLNCKNEMIRFLEKFPDNYNPPNLDSDFKLKNKPRNFEGDYEIPKQIIQTFKKTLEQVEMAKIEKDCLISLIEILKLVEKIYQDKRKKDNINNFSDISMELYKLLKTDKNNIRAKLQEKYSYIMIDEFQDTDLMQWEIAKYLAGWNGITDDYTTMKPDKLFIVGDDKQSIYGFRGGDVQVFNAAREEISLINKLSNLEGGFIQFPDNFRSSTNIIDFFNKFFYVLFGYSDKKYDAKHQNLVGHKQKGSINFFIFNKGKPNLRINENTEQAFIANQIKEIFSHNPDENIALLFRTKSKMDSFARELEKLSINYVISGGRGFYETREVTDLHNILAFLSDDRRKIELVGFLRSPMIGLSDTEIYSIKDDLLKGLKNYPEIDNMLYGEYQDNILIKKGWKQLICDLNIHELVIRIINDTNYKAYIFHDNDYLQKIKNIEKFIEICKEKENMTLHEFVEFLDYQLKNNMDEANATILELGKRQPVQLMTIHASKGLGFDTVILVDAGSAGKQIGSGETLYYGEIEDFEGNHIGFKVPKNDSFEKADTSIRTKIMDLRREKEEAELKRLLYVALTRVKHNLIVSATVEDKLGGNSNTFINFFARYFTELPDNVVQGDNKRILLNDIYFHIFNKNSEVES